MRAIALGLLLPLVGCARGVCEGQPGTCVAVELRDGGGVGAVEQVRVALQVGGAPPRGASTNGLSPGAALPVVIAVLLPSGLADATLDISAERQGALVGAGAVALHVSRDGEHLERSVTLIGPGAEVDLSAAGEDLAGVDLASPDLSDVDLSFTGDLAGTPRYVFLAGPFPGNGLDGATTPDQKCEAAAWGSTSRVPPVHYKAILSWASPTEKQAPASYLVLDQGARPIVRPDGMQVATDSTFFSSTANFNNPITLLADGTAYNASIYCAWTGFNDDGTRYSGATSCNNWTSGTTGRYGIVLMTTASWASNSDSGCASPCYLYCIEQ